MVSKSILNNNHPAFPVQAYAGDASNPKVRPNTGMSIRDYFAAKAMEGILSNPEEFGETAPPKEIADFSFQIANAMLERRERV
jgi:hypothetical protein